MGATSDNGANIVRAITDAGLPHIPCYAHTLNLCMTDVLKDVPELKNLRGKVSKIVTLTKKSTVARETLIKVQREAGRPCKALVQECPTRWNSTYLMFNRFQEEKESVRTFAEKFNVSNLVNGIKVSCVFLVKGFP